MDVNKIARRCGSVCDIIGDSPTSNVAGFANTFSRRKKKVATPTNHHDGPLRKSAGGRELLLPYPKGLNLKEDRRQRANANPQDVNTWPNRLKQPYVQVVSLGHVYQHRLEEMLKAAGYQEVWQEVLGRICAKITSESSLTVPQVFEFFYAYQDHMLSRIRETFSKRLDGEGCVPFSWVEELVDQLGYTPLPHSLSELLEEAADLAEEPFEDDDCTTWPIFEKFVELLVEREGFSQLEVRSLGHAFRRFDRDGSGTIEADEIAPILVWLGCCTDESVFGQVEEDMKGLEPITKNNFLVLLRKHRAAEYAHTIGLFDRYSTEEGTIAPGDVLWIFKKLHLSLLPETLLEVVEDCGLPYEGFTFSNFWKILQLLRLREGFTSEELKEISDTFKHFDRYRKGELFTRSLPNALRWMGYLRNSSSARARVDWKPHYGGRARISEPEFLKIVRDHAEADHSIIKVNFRKHAQDFGAGPLPFSKMKLAVIGLNGTYSQDWEDYVRKKMPHKWLRRNNATFDFEEFRRIADACRIKARDRLRLHHGFTDTELARLRVQYAQQVATSGQEPGSALPPAALVELFRWIAPAIEKSPDARDMLRRAVNIHQSDDGSLDWTAFLKVMRTYEDLLEEEQSVGTPLLKTELNIPAMQVDDYLDIFAQYIHDGPQQLTAQDMRLLYTLGRERTGSRPPSQGTPSSVFAAAAALQAQNANLTLTDKQALHLQEHLVRLQERRGVAGTVQKFVDFTKELRSLSPEALGDESDRSPSPKPGSERQRLAPRRSKTWTAN